MKAKVLIVDNEPDIRTMLKSILVNSFTVTEADSGAALKKLLGGEGPDIALLDLNLGDDNGLNLLPQIRKNWPFTEVVIITGEADYKTAVEATKRGAFHFIAKPFKIEEILVTIDRALENKQHKEENNSLRLALATMSGAASPIFRSSAMQEVVHTVERVAASDVTILLTGESGTGKEVIADLLHTLSPRNKSKIIKINCAALPRELIESELFGSVKGAYTGAHADREGLFRQAGNGTLLLDEISEMPVDTQSKLLRVLQDHEVRPVGDKTSYKTNCRILASTNRKPGEAIKDGKLREDLFYRISAITVHLPPLRERRDDIMPLANTFLKRYAAQAGREHLRIQGRCGRAVHHLRLARQRPPVAERSPARRAPVRRRRSDRRRPLHHQCRGRRHARRRAGFRLLTARRRRAQRHHPDTHGNREQQSRGRQTPRHRPPHALQQNQGLRD